LFNHATEIRMRAAVCAGVILAEIESPLASAMMTQRS
jgi:hypothetical protein